MEPITRSEQYLASILGEDVVLPIPQSRIEYYLNAIAQNGIAPSSAGLINYDPDANYPDGSIGKEMHTLDGDVSTLKSEIDELIDTKISTNVCDPEKMVVGLLTSAGAVDDSYTNRRTTDFIPASDAYICAYAYYQNLNSPAIRIAFYNSEKQKIRVITSRPEVTTKVDDNTAFVRVSFEVGTNIIAYFVGFSSTNTEMNFEYYYQPSEKINENALPGRITATDNWLFKFAECAFVGGNVHLSIDDVSSALYELANNPPTSIWDTPFFGQLKTWHETYGVCITCNCFSFLSTLASYDIADIPNTWASEFSDAKSWLKFAFHSKNNNTTYDTSYSLKDDYEYFVSAIYSMTGDYDCIDTGTRTQSFTGTKAQILETMKVSHGITMLWTADDDRNSYYFDTAQTARVDNRCKYIDDENNLLFIRSMPRLDTNTIDDIAAIISEKPQYGKMVELYCHENLDGGIESSTVTRVNNALAWFNSNGYESHFLTEIFR